MNTLAKQLICNLVDKTYNNSRGRPNKEKVAHYVDKIFKVLKSGMLWKDLEGPLYHKTYYKKFRKWSKDKIFQNTYMCLMKLLEKEQFFTERGKLLFIDSSMVRNMNGTEDIGRNHYDRMRNGSKVTIVVTQEGIILSMKVTGSNIHDSRLVLDSLEDINIKIIGTRLVGDKGYNSIKLKKEVKEKNDVILIYPLKKSQKGALTDSEKEDLSHRHVVENCFSWIRRYRRLAVRYDRLTSTMVEFYYLAALNITCNKLDKLEK